MEMPATKITTNGSVTLPAKFRKELGLAPGDMVNAELRNGVIELRPAKIIDAEDGWYYTKEWQEKEAEADADYAAGRVHGPYKDGKAAVGALRRAVKAVDKKDSKTKATKKPTFTKRTSR
ncbi:AbrB/MazE/SpoVT family DNA-binding domain-containing protein [bacterium]|nr:AbrB/MazE/SpoVT family DNA-binding domain-containing protein [bacterium]